MVREIVLALLIKLAMICGLWLAFFSHGHDEMLTDAEVSQGLLGEQWSQPTTKSRGESE